MQLPHLIDVKTKYYKYSALGAFGNQLNVWRTAEEFVESGYDGNIGLRYAGSGSGAPWLGNKIPSDCAVVTREILAEQEGYNKDDFVFCEAAPDHLLTFQGEVQQAVGGLSLRYTYEKCNMRHAFKIEELHASGVAALYLMRKHLSPASYDDFQILFDWFPGHVVEFASFSLPVGWASGRNTVVWEVRKDGVPPGWHALERKCRPGHRECHE